MDFDKIERLADKTIRLNHKRRIMMKFGIIYYSKTGHTLELAEVIARGLSAKGNEVRLFSVDEPADTDYLNACSGIIFGTPTYLATAHWRLNQWLTDDSHKIDLAGKLGGAFATAHYAQGGSDTAIMSLLGILLVRGMLVYSGGSALGKPFIHHGPVALDAVENHYKDCQKDFAIFGERFAEKAMELFDAKL